MDFLQELLKPKRNPITEIDEKWWQGLQCIKCEVTPVFLYEIDGCLICEECAEAHIRRERFKAEEAAWNEES